jgi:hypothetical protein
MSNLPQSDDDMPAEIDFSEGVRGLHQIPAGAKVFMPGSIEKNVWEYFAGKAKQQTEVLQRDIEISEALK